jgi:hypothetical protein
MRAGVAERFEQCLLDAAARCPRPRGVRYLVAPRGETQWVRNLCVAAGGELRLGARRELFRAHEIGDAEKPPVLRAYLR